MATPKGHVLLRLVRHGGPQPLYEVDSSRSTITVTDYKGGTVYKTVLLRCVTSTGFKYRKRSGPERIGPLGSETVEHYRDRMVVEHCYEEVKP